MLTIHTLGPNGTNCEKAAHHWLSENNIKGNVKLYPTLESATECVRQDKDGVLLGCIVYPDLHNIVFRNLTWLELKACFVLDTHNMLFASRHTDYNDIRHVGSHPAPQHLFAELPLLNKEVRKTLFTSNSESGVQCAHGAVDGCITTLTTAQKYHLHILHDFGPVPMGFSIHAPK
ncbi:hypothetical protein [Morganella morganii]|uniref:hypothetical protein n=1 Tax=Morganella TaxID=581 RepID=UPI001C4586A6|nr:hypothetical protein [Morganella morganii]QXO71536.1 hypothetical protein JC793_11835 [Morganella morganii]